MAAPGGRPSQVLAITGPRVARFGDSRAFGRQGAARRASKAVGLDCVARSAARASRRPSRPPVELLEWRNDDIVDRSNALAGRVTVAYPTRVCRCLGRPPTPDPESEGLGRGHLVPAVVAVALRHEIMAGEIHARPFELTARAERREAPE